MSEFYIIRHGVENNDGGITEKSKNEAKEIGEQILIDDKINNEKIREQILIVTSSITRALKTAESINEGFDNNGNIFESDSLTLGNKVEGFSKQLLSFLKNLPPYLIYIFITHQPTANKIAHGLGYKGDLRRLGNLDYYKFESNKINEPDENIIENPEIDYSKFEEANYNLVKIKILTDENGEEVDEIKFDEEIDYTDVDFIDKKIQKINCLNEEYLNNLSSNINFKNLPIDTKDNFFELDIPYHFKIEFYYYQQNLISELFNYAYNNYFTNNGIIYELLGENEMERLKNEFENIKEKPFIKMQFVENLKITLHNIVLNRLNKSENLQII